MTLEGEGKGLGGQLKVVHPKIIGVGALPGGGLGLCLAQQVHEHARADIQKHAAHKGLERLGVGQIDQPDPAADDDAGQGAHHHHPGQGPEHAALADKAPDATGDGHDVVDHVGGADGRAGKAQYIHGKRQEQERARDAAHGGEKADAKRDQGW